ncbi:olfactory receptor 2AT4-like [Pseudoliparis swirei]|uniref:olfactory receptor 2AT4-like n=1 Tax=Pseudoliparis swirei TaxID=2059687 RepID=UPI0024BF04CE|nr:olfactory receptor 2AT4-like [Pseudoliparis swirei]
MFFVHYLGSVTSFILLVMALDRFIAICVPMRYPVLITNNTISVLCGFAWFIPLPLMIAIVLHALTLPFCKSNVIAQCYCDHISIMSQACGENVQIVQVTTFCMAMFCLLLPLAFILFSYIYIIVVILKMANAAGRKRTLSTCTPQLFITCLFYLPSLDVRIIMVLLYSLIPAAVNPLIYCFKTQDIKQTLTDLRMHRQVSVCTFKLLDRGTELSVFQCVCKNKMDCSCHRVHCHFELSTSQLAAQLLLMQNAVI